MWIFLIVLLVIGPWCGLGVVDALELGLVRVTLAITWILLTCNSHTTQCLRALNAWPTIKATKSIPLKKDNSNSSTQSSQSTTIEDERHALFFINLRHSSKLFLYNQDKTFSNKPHEMRRRQRSLVFDDVICPCQSFELLDSSTKMNYFEVIFSEVPNFPTQNEHKRGQRKKNYNVFNSVTRR